MTEHNLIHGFREERIVPIPELAATLHQFSHPATGLELIWLEREDENKTFAITFTTLPDDDTGVFHILEHSVLCGSRHYPVKEPFVELMKGSLNTFLNALTFPDKTMYPISSRNDADFLNLVRVYLDAVFCPSIYDKPEIFQQEGWHYEPAEDGTMSYRGVVFNEMKGAFADADTLLENEINRRLFPDTPYAFVSGGDPEAIPSLTYESFLRHHQNCYSPSNAFVFLDGRLNLSSVLAILDEEYLKDCSNTGRLPSAPLQAPIDGGTGEIFYELGPDESPERKHRLSFGFVAGTYDMREKLTAAELLTRALCGSNTAPLKRALLDDGLAENVSFRLMDDVKQPWLCLEIQGLREQDIPEAESRLMNALSKQMKELDHSRLLAEITNMEFRQREKDYGSYPAGLVNAFLTLGSWQYGGLPEANLSVGTLFDDLRRHLDEGWFEKLVQELLLDNPHRCKVLLHPSASIGEERRAKERKRLQEECARWSEEDKSRILSQQASLLAWQRSEDTPEQLSSLPCLTLQDIQDMPEELTCQAAVENEIPVLTHSTATNGIVYTTLYFDADDLTSEELTKLSFICLLLGKLPTRSHSAKELQQRAKLLCGSMSFRLNVFAPENSLIPYTCKFAVSFSSLENNTEAALELALELLTESCTNHIGEVTELLKQERQRMFEHIVTGGVSFASNRLEAQTSVSAAVREATGYLEYYRRLKALEDSMDFETVCPEFETLLGQIAVQSRCTLSLAGCDSKTVSTIAAAVHRLPAGSPDAKTHPIEKLSPLSEGLMVPGDVGFAVKGGSFTSCGKDYDGHLALAAKIIELGFLWNVIRVRGGAYGTGLTYRSSGFTACYSYRDPSTALSLKSFSGCGQYLRDYLKEEPDYLNYLIGTVADASPLMSPRTKASVSDAFYWRGLTQDTRCRIRRELLNTTPTDLILWADALEEAFIHGQSCVVGGKEQLDSCELPSTIMI